MKSLSVGGLTTSSTKEITCNHALCVLNFRMFSDLFDERSNVERIHRAFFRYDVDTRKRHSKDDVVTGSTTNKSHSVTDARSQHATVAIS